MTDILQKDNAVLRTTAHEVALDEITSAEIQGIIRRMKEAVHEQNDGVAIAAPQIGEPVRIFVIAGRAFALMRDEDPLASDYDDVVCINPRVTKTSRKSVWMDEGCLSVRWQYGQVERFEKATIEAYNENGERFTLGGSGLMAQIFQHEIDHLDGTLFIDKARNIREEKPGEQSSQLT